MGVSTIRRDSTLIKTFERQDIAWTNKHRGSVSSFHVDEKLVKRMRDDHQDPTPIQSLLRLKSVAGWGSYRWKYDPDVVHSAISLGVGVIDTAEGYGFGRVETELGKVFSQYSTDDLPCIASKFSRNHARKQSVINAGRRSQDRLRLDRIPLYQLHWPDPSVNYQETLEGLLELKLMGVIERVGVCNCGVYQLSKLMRAAVELGLVIDTNQIPINSETFTYTRFLIQKCVSWGVNVLAHSSFGQGKSIGDLSWLDGSICNVLIGTNSIVHLEENVKLVNKKRPSKRA